MCGWFSDDAICASRWKRRRASASASSSESNLIATGRFSLVSERDTPRPSRRARASPALRRRRHGHPARAASTGQSPEITPRTATRRRQPSRAGFTAAPAPAKSRFSVIRVPSFAKRFREQPDAPLGLRQVVVVEVDVEQVDVPRQLDVVRARRSRRSRGRSAASCSSSRRERRGCRPAGASRTPRRAAA